MGQKPCRSWNADSLRFSDHFKLQLIEALGLATEGVIALAQVHLVPSSKHIGYKGTNHNVCTVCFRILTNSLFIQEVLLYNHTNRNVRRSRG